MSEVSDAVARMREQYEKEREAQGGSFRETARYKFSQGDNRVRFLRQPDRSVPWERFRQFYKEDKDREFHFFLGSPAYALLDGELANDLVENGPWSEEDVANFQEYGDVADDVRNLLYELQDSDEYEDDAFEDEIRSLYFRWTTLWNVVDRDNDVVCILTCPTTVHEGLLDNIFGEWGESVLGAEGHDVVVTAKGAGQGRKYTSVSPSPKAVSLDLTEDPYDLREEVYRVYRYFIPLTSEEKEQYGEDENPYEDMSAYERYNLLMFTWFSDLFASVGVTLDDYGIEQE